MRGKKQVRLFEKRPERVMLVFFSGTGGTKMVTDRFETELIKREISVFKHSLDPSIMVKEKHLHVKQLSEVDVVMLLYAVHAFDAPVPVFDWINILPRGNDLPVAVVSVSGGGEISLNRACRTSCISELEEKGYHVFFETMMVMPCNIFIPTDDNLAIRLLQAVPEKSGAIIDKILAGEVQRTRPKFMTRIMARLIAGMEKSGAKTFGRSLRTTPSCSGCMRCVHHCPESNISMSEGNITFGDTCILCLRCVYNCPSRAIYPTRAKFILIKNGFNLDAISKKMADVSPIPLDECCKGILWQGVKSYLSD